MQGLMMAYPLLIKSILNHAVRTFADQEIVTRLVEGGDHRYTYADCYKRICQAAHALKAMGVKEGDRIGVMGWNTHRQLELYYAISCIGAVCHTINPRLGPENANYVINHAGDSILLYDTTFEPLVAALRSGLTTVKHFVVLTDKQNLPKSSIKAAAYEDLLRGQPDHYEWPTLDENAASAMCYTSGTTGKPKGVLYSHRSTVMQTFMTSLSTSFGADYSDVVLPVVPMFHVNAWNVPYSALMSGLKLVLPGAGLDGANLFSLMEQEKVTFALGVPTIWLNLLNYVESEGKRFSTLEYTLVGGAALPEAIIRGYERLGVKCRQGWGMTEMSPTGTTNFEPIGFYDQPIDERIPYQLKQGRALPFVDMRIVGEDGAPLPHDGVTPGNLQVQGPCVLSAYYKHDAPTLTEDGWFDTGDVATIDQTGMLTITDRSKDVIKSGGEWISTIDIENVALLHPDVAQAAVIGMPHPKWDERPLLIVELVANSAADPQDILSFVRERLPKLSWPDDIQVVDEIPLGATGKVLKTKLREMFKDYVLPELRGDGAREKKRFSLFSFFRR